MRYGKRRFTYRDCNLHVGSDLAHTERLEHWESFSEENLSSSIGNDFRWMNLHFWGPPAWGTASTQHFRLAAPRGGIFILVVLLVPPLDLKRLARPDTIAQAWEAHQPACDGRL